MGSAMLKQKVADGTYKDHVLTNEVTTIGRSKDNDIVVNDSSLSRLHIRVENRNGQYFVIDNNSSNGTFLNRHKITKAPLKHGDLVIAGRISFYFQQEQDLGVSKTQAMVAMEDPGATRIGVPVASDIQAPPASGIPPLKETFAGPTPDWQQQAPVMPPPTSTMRASFPETLEVPAEQEFSEELLASPPERTAPPSLPPQVPVPQEPAATVPPPFTPPGSSTPSGPSTPPPFQSPFDPPAVPTAPPPPQADTGPIPPHMPPSATPPEPPPYQAPTSEAAPQWELPPIQAPAANPPVPQASGHMSSDPNAGASTSPIQLGILRLVAIIIDSLLLFVLMIPGVILQFLDMAMIGGILSLLLSLVALVHPIVGWMKYGKTIGKHLLGLKIVERDHPDQTGLGIKTIVMRIIGMMISAIPFSIPYLMVLFDEEGRGLHDRLANTRVIKTR